MNRRIWVLVAGYATLRWVLLTSPGYVADVLSYKGWALAAARHGLSQVYANSHIDYPPLYAWILYPIGQLYIWLSGAGAGPVQDSTLFTVLIKFPPLLFDLAIAAVAWRIGRRLGAADSSAPQSRWSWEILLPAAYLLNPAVLFNHGYWGQVDSIHSFFVLTSFLALVRLGRGPGGGRIASAALAWSLLTLATTMKPLGAPFFPWMLFLTLLVYGSAAVGAGAAAAVVTAGIVFLPFLATGQGGTIFARVVGDIGAMPYTSTNAHNFWWVIGPWRDSETPWIGPFTATHIGVALFGTAYLLILYRGWRLHRDQPGGLRPIQWVGMAAAVGFSFFMFATHMHENHMFIVIPLLLPLLPAGGRWRALFVAVTLGVTANLVLHDLTIPERWPFTLGGPTGFTNPHLQRPFHALELGAIWASTVWNLATYAVFLWVVLRPGPGNWIAALVGTAATESAQLRRTEGRAAR